jgi:hypothetical protein
MSACAHATAGAIHFTAGFAPAVRTCAATWRSAARSTAAGMRTATWAASSASAATTALCEALAGESHGNDGDGNECPVSI